MKSWTRSRFSKRKRAKERHVGAKSNFKKTSFQSQGSFSQRLVKTTTWRSDRLIIKFRDLGLAKVQTSSVVDATFRPAIGRLCVDGSAFLVDPTYVSIQFCQRQAARRE